MEEIQIETSRIREYLTRLHAGERVLLTGEIYTVRDAAHQRLWDLLEKKKPLPFSIQDAIFYYAAPAPARDGMATGACGPTTSRRMDKFTPRLLAHGLAATIGKGDRGLPVEISIRENAACHFAAVGGAGALLAGCIESAEVVAFPELGCEAVYRMRVKDFPVIVAIDCRGGNLYRSGKAIYRQV
ncbi:MAG: TRZ/ATZ family protein [Clostridia bacterium]|nr:TRZ/ATZ family protein [Clostridia bacterium]